MGFCESNQHREHKRKINILVQNLIIPEIAQEVNMTGREELFTIIELVQLNKIKKYNDGNQKLITIYNFLWDYEVEILIALAQVNNSSKASRAQLVQGALPYMHNPPHDNSTQ